MMKSRFAYLAGVAGVAFSASSAQAQDVVEADDAFAIVVTAQFREQSLQDTPIAITAVDAKTMEARSQTEISEVAAQAPSVTLKPQSSNFGPSLSASIRGVGEFDFNPALEPGVGVYVDDVYYATLTGSIFDLLDLERIEVLRGPQGTLAGKNSIGGAVKLYSQKPTGSNSGYVSATYGSRNRLDVRASADFALTDTLSARLSGVSKRQDGYVERLDYGCANPGSAIPANPAIGSDCVVADESDVNYTAVRGMLRFQPSDVLDLTIIGDYTHDARNAAGSVLTYAAPTAANTANPGNVSQYPGVVFDSRFICGNYCNYSTYSNFAGDFTLPNGAKTPLVESTGDGRSLLDSWGVSANADIRLSDRLSLTSITAYRAYVAEFTNDADLSPLALNMGWNRLDYWQFSQELRLNGTFGDADQIAWTLGGYYLEQASDFDAYQDLRNGAAAFQFYGGALVPANTRAGFAHVSWEAINGLTLNLGLRYTDEEKTYTYERIGVDGNPHASLGALDGLVGYYSDQSWDYRVNLQYRWSPSLMTYAQVSTGFRGGGINPRPFAADQALPFGPEKLTTYEIGFKSDLLDRALRLNGAAYRSDYKDIQMNLLSCPTVSSAPRCLLRANAGTARIQGFELELVSEPVAGLNIDGAVSLTDFEYTEIAPGVDGIFLDSVAPYTPEWKLSGGIQYEISLGDAGSLTPRLDAAYQSGMYSNAQNGPYNYIDGYTVANARLTYRSADDDLTIALAVTNLFDKYYFLTSYENIGNSGIASAQPGRPREFAISVKKNF